MTTEQRVHHMLDRLATEGHMGTKYRQHLAEQAHEEFRKYVRDQEAQMQALAAQVPHE